MVGVSLKLEIPENCASVSILLGNEVERDEKFCIALRYRVKHSRLWG